MRLRIQRRIRKQLRRMRGHHRCTAAMVAALDRKGTPLLESLRRILVDPSHYYERLDAAMMLAEARDNRAVDALLELFFEQSEKDDLYCTALTLERLNDRRAVGPLIEALLGDDNPHRRHAAARALGWIDNPGRQAALALARCLADPTQPQPAREEAAESLSYVGTRETIEPLVAALSDADVRIRFWAAFGLVSSRSDPRAIQGLERVLQDGEAPPGNWWSVGKEALATLGTPMRPPAGTTRPGCPRSRTQFSRTPTPPSKIGDGAESYSIPSPANRAPVQSLK
ncbi:MAG: HEAT repeat domain-containing protein [Bryobacteraceae bacterium]